MRKTDLNLLRATWCVGFVIGLTACNGTEIQVSPRLSPVEETRAVTPEKEISAEPVSLSEQIKLAKEELVQRLGMAPESITLIEARPVTWRSGALGCPKQGMSYTQSLVPGTLIVLKVGNDVHDYHAKLGGKPFYCPRNRAEQPVSVRGTDLT